MPTTVTPSRNDTLILKAPLSGVLVPIEEVPDPVFAGKLVGDGISIDPTSAVLVAPCDGEVVQIHAARHALTLRTTDGFELVIHIGIDTVQLKGEGFRPRVEVATKVTTGQPLIEFDVDQVARRAKSLLTQILVTNGDRVAALLKASGRVKVGEDPILEIVPKRSEPKSVERKRAETLTADVVVIPNRSGLHARPAAVFVNHSKRFKSDIQLCRGGDKANAKSVVSIMTLNVQCGDKVFLTASGSDSAEALTSLVPLLKSGLGEASDDSPTQVGGAPVTTPPRPPRSTDPSVVLGLSASPGLAVGKVFQLQRAVVQVSEVSEEPAKESRKLDLAIDRALGELDALETKFRACADAGKAAIFAAHRELLEDPDLLSVARTSITDGSSVQIAWNEAFTAHAERLASLPNELLRGRANDVKDVGLRVLRHLTGVAEEAQEYPPETLLVAEDLTPSDTANLDRSRVLGFCTIGGGPTSHVSIMARSLGIPAMAGSEPRILDVPTGTRAILDGFTGTLKLNPTDEEIKGILQRQERGRAKHATDLQAAHEPAITLDGHRVHVMANVGGVGDGEEAVHLGAEGVGLLRSEFLFMHRASAPSEDDQFEAYEKTAKALGPTRTLIIRTLDVGGDKPLSYLPIPKEINPFLGERGVRVSLERPEILRTQLRAILRTSRVGKVWVMFPMVSCLDEWRAVKSILDEETARLAIAPIPAGIMVEVPSAAVMSDRFAREVDFFSIGTNDLTQYTLAIDRGHPKLGSRADSLDPAILRLIHQTVEGAHRHARQVGVCGGIASDVKAVSILVGLGVDELSVAVPSVPTVKAEIRRLRYSDCRKMAQKALEMATSLDVRALTQAEDGRGTGEELR